MDELLGAGFMDDGSDGEDGELDDHVSPSMSLSMSYKLHGIVGNGRRPVG